MLYWLDALFPPRADERALRGVSAAAFAALSDARRTDCTRPATIALLPFSDARVRAAVHEAKYHGSEKAFALLAAALARFLRDETMPGPRILVPVPLGTSRRRERGYNQVEEVARRVGAELGIAVDAELLARTRETASQTALGRREREENMRGAFGAAHPASPSMTYILLDDVLTTGATLQAAIDALANAGVARILPVALAH
ncbi:MAG TPA: phosphoribosyltransferase family protein [Candidatus Paceibacterota bacterium]|nr:phosphoribosyltransferase family protein [Candidatus Paceibacterota bacterium]